MNALGGLQVRHLWHILVATPHTTLGTRWKLAKKILKHKISHPETYQSGRAFAVRSTDAVRIEPSLDAFASLSLLRLRYLPKKTSEALA